MLQGFDLVNLLTSAPDLSKKDKNFRRYASAVERVLAQFETAVENWADYISFLTRLLKVRMP